MPAPILARAADLITYSIDKDDTTRFDFNGKAIFPRLSCINDRFARYLPPHLCTRTCVLHKELRFFFHPSMRNTMTMSRVRQLNVRFFHVTRRSAVMDSEEQILELVTSIRRRMRHILKLEMRFDINFGNLLFASKTLFSHLLAELPTSSLQSLMIDVSGSGDGEFDEAAEDIRQEIINDCSDCDEDYDPFDSPPSDIMISSKDLCRLAAMPQLRELRLIGNIFINKERAAQLFRPALAPQQQQQQQQPVFFPSLQQLECTVDVDHWIQLLSIAARSTFFPRLTEFSLALMKSPLVAVSVTSLLSLQCLSHLRAIGNEFLVGVRLPFPLDFSPLKNVRKVGDGWLQDASFNSGFPLDLNKMVSLQDVGSNFLAGVRGLRGTSLAPSLPPNLRSVGKAFAARADIMQLDFAPVARSLRTIDLEEFANRASIARFTTAPFAGKVVGTAAKFLSCCVKLVECDLSGLIGVSHIADSFLSHCSALKIVSGMFGMSRVEYVEGSFLSYCGSVVDCDVSKMAALRHVYDNLDAFIYRSALAESAKKTLFEIMAENGKNAPSGVVPPWQRRLRDDDDEESQDGSDCSQDKDDDDEESEIE